MTTEQTALQRLKAICEKATQGKWSKATHSEIRSELTWVRNENNDQVCAWVAMSDADSIIAAHEALPALIELCETQERLVAAKASAQLKDALGRAFLDQRYLDAVADLNSASNAVEAARARLEDVCPK